MVEALKSPLGHNMEVITAKLHGSVCIEQRTDRSVQESVSDGIMVAGKRTSAIMPIRLSFQQLWN